MFSKIWYLSSYQEYTFLEYISDVTSTMYAKIALI